MERFLHYIFGFVRFSATGGFTERFLNLAQAKKISVWRTKNTRDGFTGETTIFGYKQLTEPAKKSGVKLHVLSKHGLPFFYKRIYGRIGLFIGICLFAVLFTFYTKTVWRIEVSGNDKISESAILSSAEKGGLYMGVLKGNVNTAKLRKVITDELPSLAWVNVNVDGSFCNIEVLEGSSAVVKEKEKGAVNIVATQDGTVTDITVYDGQQVVNVGDSVCRGDLLVSGAIYYENTKSTVFHSSRANVYADVDLSKKVVVNKRMKKTYYTGNDTVKRVLNFWRLKIPLYFFDVGEGNFEVSETSHQCEISGVKIPVSVRSVAYREIRTKEVNISKREAEILARSQARDYEKDFPQNTKILSKEVKVKEESDRFIFTYSYKVNENIARRVKLDVGKK